MKKYEFTEETICFAGRTLHRIRAIKDFGSVKAGELGGFLEKEGNLSHEGNAWVIDNARIYGDAWISGNAWVRDNAWISGDAWVRDNALISDNARIYGDARISGNAWVYGDAWISGNALVSATSHYLVVGPVGDEDEFTTFYKTKNGISVVCNCFSGDIEAFSKELQDPPEGNAHTKAYQLAVELAKLRVTPEAVG